MASCYLDDEHFRRINTAAQDSRHIQTARQQLLDEAEQFLTQDALSVRSATNSPYLLTDAVYIPGQDGVVNPERNQKGFHLLHQVGDRALTLAYAWRLTAEQRYADKSLELIHAWCVNENTRMFATGQVEGPATPGMTHGGNVGMMMSLPLLFTAVYLMDDYRGWGITAHECVRRWVRDMAKPQHPLMFYAGHEMYNNWEDARLRYLATAALALDDLELLQYCFDRWRSIIPVKMDEQGALPRECERTRSMTYTVAALGMAADVAEIASAFHVDLYNYEHNGKSLKLAVDYAAHHLLHIDEWPHQLLHPIEEEMQNNKHFGMWELAYRQWQDPRYLDIIERYAQRPLRREHATLIFGQA